MKQMKLSLALFLLTLLGQALGVHTDFLPELCPMDGEGCGIPIEFTNENASNKFFDLGCLDPGVTVAQCIAFLKAEFNNDWDALNAATDY